MPKPHTKFHDLSKIRVKFNGANLQHNVNLRPIWRDFGAFRLDVAKFCSSLREPCAPFVRHALLYFAPLASLRLVSFHLLALPCLAPVKTSKFFHSTLEFLRFVASRPDRFVSCSRAYYRVLAYLDRAQSYRIDEVFLYKFCFF